MTNEDFMTRVLVTLNDIQMELRSVKAENTQLKEALNSFTNLDFAERRWCDDMCEKADRIATRKGEHGKQVLAEIYLHLRNVYGFVVDDERQKFRIKYNVDKAPSTLALIYHSDFRRVFENLLAERWEKVKPDIFKTPMPTVEETVPEIAEVSEPVEETPREETLSEKIEKIKNRIEELKEITGNTQQKGRGIMTDVIYSRMNIAWNNLQSRYNKAHGRDKFKPVNKMRLIADSTVAYREFMSVCRQIEKEAKSNENNI